MFSAARRGNSASVKKGIWEDHVDAAGGEVKKGCEAFVKSAPSDASETLLHIVAARGDLDLFQWLDTHGKVLVITACPELICGFQVPIWKDAVCRTWQRERGEV